MELLKSSKGRLLIESHRGVQDGLPENSWQAIKRAHEQKADFIEIDVQLSKDRVPFLRHNYTLPDGRKCHEATWAELRDIKPEGAEFPALEDCLDWARSVDAYLSLDLKTGFMPEKLLVEQIRGQIQRQQCWDQVMLMGWDHKELLEIKSSFPEAITRVFVNGRPVDITDVVKKAQANAVSLSYGVARPSDIAELHNAGISVVLAELWELNVPHIHELDVDIICVGKPAEARKALGFI